ncbi:hypothetical protein [Brevundimonas faecalis]|uniref:DUF2188 domain-containing protein n=1 Tax=Brevundimonas faecalis TaxID=947378 RepID=A0ABV2R9I3_9CAUL
MRTIVVEPFGEAWAVRVDDMEPQLFTRGRAAEEAAKDTAERLSAAGDHVEIHLYLRNGERAARFICLPPVSSDDTPHLVGGSLLAVAGAACEMTEAAA